MLIKKILNNSLVLVNDGDEEKIIMGKGVGFSSHIGEKVDIKKIEKIFSFGVIQHNNSCCFLKDILQFAIEEKVCEIKYSKKGIEGSYYVQFFDIYSSFGQWYVTGYNFKNNVTQVFRCDKILDVKVSTQYQPKALADFIKSSF